MRMNACRVVRMGIGMTSFRDTDAVGHEPQRGRGRIRPVFGPRHAVGQLPGQVQRLLRCQPTQRGLRLGQSLGLRHRLGQPHSFAEQVLGRSVASESAVAVSSTFQRLRARRLRLPASTNACAKPTYPSPDSYFSA